MSATNRGRERIKDDAYLTPSWSVHRLLEKITLPAGRWLEPCAGEGAIIRAVNEKRKDVVWGAAEVRPECLPALKKLGFDKGSLVDFLRLDPNELVGKFEVVFTNPPYSLAEEFLERGLEVCPHVVFLLRLNFLGSSDRHFFLKEYTPDVYVLPNRPSFVQAVSCSLKKTGCDYNTYLPPNVQVPRDCPKCKAPVEVSSSDATEYAWFHFQQVPRAEGKLVMLDATDAAVRLKKTA